MARARVPADASRRGGTRPAARRPFWATSFIAATTAAACSSVSPSMKAFTGRAPAVVR